MTLHAWGSGAKQHRRPSRVGQDQGGHQRRKALPVVADVSEARHQHKTDNPCRPTPSCQVGAECVAPPPHFIASAAAAWIRGRILAFLDLLRSFVRVIHPYLTCAYADPDATGNGVSYRVIHKRRLTFKAKR